jgi:hypothetical protein
MKYLKVLFISLIMMVLVVLPQISLAEGNLDTALTGLQKAGTKAVGEDTVKVPLSAVIGQVIATALSLVGMIFLVLTVYGGYLWMTARGEEEQVTKAQKIIIETMIGLVVVLSAYAITLLVTGRLGQL